MNLQAFGQCLNNANARYLMALLNSAHVTPAGCHQHVLLRQTAQGTQLSKRVAKVGSSGNMFARLHRLDFRPVRPKRPRPRSEEHTSELQSQSNLVCRLLLEKKKKNENHSYQ